MIWYAAETGNYDSVKHLIARGADVNAMSPTSIDDRILASPLWHSNLSTCDLLLAAGCAVDRLYVLDGRDMNAMDIIFEHLQGDTRDDAIELLEKYHPGHDWGPQINEYVSVWHEAFELALKNRPWR